MTTPDKNLLNFSQQNDQMKKAITSSVEAMFPIVNGNKRLELQSITVDDSIDDYDFPRQKEIKLNRATWEVPIYAKLAIVDSITGKTIDKAEKIKIGSIPKITPRFSVIIEGNEYSTINQIRRKSGVYSRIKKNGELESEFNLSRGKNFKMELDPTTQVFNVILDNRRYRLWTLLNLLGVGETELKKNWGSDLLEINKNGALTNEASELDSLYRKFVNKAGSSDDMAIRTGLVDYFNRTELDPDTTKITLGDSFSNVSGGAMLAASVRLLKINKGESEPDDRDSLIFKKIYSPDDLVSIYFDKQAPMLKKKLERTLGLKEKVRETISGATFGGPVKRFFTVGDLASTPPQTNPATMIAEWRKTSPMGTGGIESHHAITNETRAVQATHLGFIDPLATPDGGKVGITVGLASEVQKIGNEMATPLIDINAGKIVWMNPAQFFNHKVGFPDQYKLDDPQGLTGKPISENVVVMYQGKTQEMPATEVEYYLRSPKSMFSLQQNLVPFLQNVQGNRASMSSRYITQALSLKDREVPLIQTFRGTKSNGEVKTYQQLIGRAFTPITPVSGRVTKVTNDYIFVTPDAGGEPKKVGLYKDFPLNQDGYLDSTPVVSVGDEVKKGQILAEINYTRGETLALGRNMNIALMSYKGYNFEDGIVISENAAKKLAHEMIHQENVFYNPKLSVLDKAKFNAWFPDVLTQDNFNKLDERGIIKVGATVMPGDAIVAILVEKQLDDLDQALKKLDKITFSNYSKYMTKWENEDPGIVTDVRMNGRNIDIYIKAEHPMRVGDKLAASYGNKGIVTKIVPDSDMPYVKATGKPIEILMSPEGVPNRMNIGQILETSASKIAEKTGKPYIVNNFEDASIDWSKKVSNELAENGLTTDDILVDGETGQQIKTPIFTGKQYMYKLRHIIDKKMAAHDYGAYDINEQPAGKGAQKIGQMETYAYLSHGSKSLLRDAATIKSRKNEDYWRDLQLGLPPRPPARNFVFEKLTTYLKGAGVNVKKEGNTFRIMPMTDADVMEMSSGEITDPGALLVGKNLATRKNGLFDPAITGGLKGNNWGHITLAYQMPNPMYEDAIRKALDLTEAKYDSILEGKSELHGFTGPLAIVRALNFDVDSKLSALEAELKTAPPTNVNKLNTKIKYLRALKDLKYSPVEAYTMQKVPIIPPVFRPIYALPSGDLMVSDINKHYRDLGLINEGLKSIGNDLTPEELIKDQNTLYGTIKGLQGLSDPLTYSDEKYKGFLKEIGKTKTGLVHGTAWSKRQDLSGRSTITVDSTLGLDEVGLPKEIAYKIYKPYVVRELKEMGMKATDALKAYQEESPLAIQSLLNVMKDRPIILNRAPSLHKHSVQAFMPLLTDGKDIKLNALINKGLSSDFNGDSVSLALTTLIIKVGDRYFSGSFEQLLKEIIVPGATDEQLLELTQNGTAILQISNTKILSTDSENKVTMVPVNEITIHGSHGDCYEIKISGHLENIFSEHHNFSIINKDTMVEEMIKTEDMTGKELIPIVKNIFIPEEDIIHEINLEKELGKEFDSRSKLNKTVKLDFNFGYWLGSFAGDGSANVDTGTITIACIHPETQKLIMESFAASVSPTGKSTVLDFSQYPTGSKIYFYSADLAKLLKIWCGNGAKNKQLPGWFLTTPIEFRRGLIAGLIETDGCITTSNKAKSWVITMETISRTLMNQTQILMKSVDIQSSLNTQSRKTKTDNLVYKLIVDSESKYVLPLVPGGLREATRAKYMKSMVSAKGTSGSMLDAVPFNDFIYTDIVKNTKPADSLSIKDLRGRSLISRNSANKFRARVTDENIKKLNEVTLRWIKLVDNNFIKYANIVSINKVDRLPLLGDFSVPEKETFVIDGGVITHNTMSVMVPVSRDAVQEAYKMLPSNILYKHGDNQLMPELSKDYIYGLWALSKIEGDSGKTFKNIEEAKKAIDWNMTATIAGKRTTVGQWLINEPLPAPYRDYTREINGKSAEKILNQLGKEAPGIFSNVINRWKDLGASYSYMYGHTISLNDFTTDKSFRDNILRDAMKGINKKSDEEKVKIYMDATQKIQANQMKALAGTNLAYMMQSGSMKSGDSVRQITSLPGVLVDLKGNAIPVPVLKSYGEGVDTPSYFNSLYAVRKGTVDRSVNTQDSGALNKSLLSVTRNLVVSRADCGTEKGIAFSVDSKDLMDRALLESIKGVGRRNDIINSEIILKAKKVGLTELPVRSPLTCEAVEGVCQLCYGLMPNGQLPQVGANVGISEGQALSERSTQLTMKTFHCFHPGVSVFTEDHKLMTIKDIVDSGYSGKILDLDGKYVQVKKAWKHKVTSPVIYIKTKDGESIVLQDNHPVQVIQNTFKCQYCSGKLHGKVNQCKICMRRSKDATINHDSIGAKTIEAKNILPNDHSFIVNRFPANFGAKEWDFSLSPYMVGAWITEGNCNERNKAIIWTQNHDTPIYNKYAKELGKHTNTKNIGLYGKDLYVKMTTECGTRSFNKHLPLDILNYSTETVYELIAGIIDGDGTIQRFDVAGRHSGNDLIILDSTSYALINQMHILCNALGIVSNVHKATVKKISNHQPLQLSMKLTKEQQDMFSKYSLKIKDMKLGIPLKFRDGNTIKKKQDFFYNFDSVYDIETESGTLLVNEIWMHNSGGSALSKGGITEGFPRIEQLLKVPEKLSGKATLAATSGIVDRVSENAIGGHDIWINAKKHVVLPGLELLVKPGEKVKVGDRLSSGNIKPQELGELKSHLDAQRYIVDELDSIYDNKFYKKSFETVVRAISDNAEITEAPDDSGFLRGDNTSLSSIQSINKKRKKEGLPEIGYISYFKSIDTQNTESPDWLTKLTTNRAKAALMSGAPKGEYANIKGKDPIPAYIYGDQFGEDFDPDKGQFY